MGRNLDNKCKQCRREGTKLFLKGDRCFSTKCGVVKRNFVPGVHGVRLGRGTRLSSYGIQLREKQKAKRTYRILEKQLSNYFAKAKRIKGDTGAILYELLEMRLDNVIYRAGFVPSRDQARQLIGHGHFLVNGKKVNIPSYQVKVNDKVTISTKALKIVLFEGLTEKLKTKEVNEWLAVDAKELSATVIGKPVFSKNQANFELTLITEFYSR